MSDIRTVPSLDFRLSKPQRWHDSWRRVDRICRYVGSCIVCSSRCYSFDDGENDPRGVLGDRHAASWLMPTEDAGLVHLGDATDEDEVVICFNCANTYELYKLGVELAIRRWKLRGWRLP